MSTSEAKWTFLPFVLASSITSCLLLTFVKSHARIFSIFYHSLSTATSASGIFMVWGKGKICVQNWNTVVSCSSFPAICSWWFGKDFHIRSLVDSLASKIHASFDLISLDLPRIAPCFPFLLALQGIAGAIGVSNFSRARFLWIPRLHRHWNEFFVLFLPLSRFGFSCDHFCLSFSLAFLPILIQSSGHKWSGLDVNCFLVSLSPDHKNPSGVSSYNEVNWVKPVQESDKSLDPSMFQ